MKTFREFLEESWHSSARAWYTKDTHFDVYKNPSKSELHKIVHSSEAKSARAIIHGSDVYVWDAMHGIHDNVKDHLGIDTSRKNFISIGKDRYGSEYTGNGDISHIKEHPWVKKTLPDHRFFHG